MKEHVKKAGQQFKHTPVVVVVVAVALIIGAFGVGFALGDSKESSDFDNVASKGFHRQGGQGPGPGGGRFFDKDARPNGPFGQMGKKLEKFHDCLKDEGVERPSPGNPPSSKDRDKLQSAMKKCAEDLPQMGGRGDGLGGPGGPPGGGPGPGGPPGGGQGFHSY